MVRLRKVWLKIHLALALTAGLLFAFAGLTGSLLVFDHFLDERINSHMMLTPHQGKHLPLEQIISLAQAFPEENGSADAIHYPRTSDGVYTVMLRPQKGTSGKDAMELFIDPVTGDLLGKRMRGQGLMATIYHLHASLLSGKTGKTILGILAILVLISIITGVLLWWPLLKAGVRIAFFVRPTKWVFDLHKSSGILFAPILFLIAFTGIHLTLPQMTKPVVTLFSAETKLPRNLKSSKTTSQSGTITADEAVQIAEKTMPGCRLMSVDLPAKADDAYRVFVRQVGEVGDLRGVGRIWIDRYSGEVLGTRDWNKFTFADTYFRIQLALHNGDAFGLIGRWLFLLAGLMPAILYVTGFVLWWRKKRSKGRQKSAKILARKELLASVS